jgi:hypothetical protein
MGRILRRKGEKQQNRENREIKERERERERVKIKRVDLTPTQGKSCMKEGQRMDEQHTSSL